MLGRSRNVLIADGTFLPCKEQVALYLLWWNHHTCFAIELDQFTINDEIWCLFSANAMFELAFEVTKNIILSNEGSRKHAHFLLSLA